MSSFDDDEREFGWFSTLLFFLQLAFFVLLGVAASYLLASLFATAGNAVDRQVVLGFCLLVLAVLALNGSNTPVIASRQEIGWHAILMVGFYFTSGLKLTRGASDAMWAGHMTGQAYPAFLGLIMWLLCAWQVTRIVEYTYWRKVFPSRAKVAPRDDQPSGPSERTVTIIDLGAPPPLMGRRPLLGDKG